jgi:prepilin-type N-terminal cleavage/methylation domain-containing protein
MALMAKKKAKVMMPISTVQTPINTSGHRRPRALKRRFKSVSRDGFSLMEMIVVLGVLCLLTTVVVMNFGSKVGKSSFKREAMEIVNTLKMAQNGGSQSGSRYAVLFDFIEQTYTVKQVHTLVELETIDEQNDEITLQTTNLSERCRIEYITFDDLTDTRDVGEIEDQEELKSYFVAGRSGWQNGGKIGLTDIDGNEYSIIVNRMSKSIMLEDGYIDTFFLEPKENLAF